MDSFRQFFDSRSPIFINLIIFPFKKILIHEGLFVPYNIMIGSRMGSSMKAEAEEIDSLREKSPELEAVYNHEVGRINSKQIKSQLKKQSKLYKSTSL
jgi:hypothetical protein